MSRSSIVRQTSVSAAALFVCLSATSLMAQDTRAPDALPTAPTTVASAASANEATPPAAVAVPPLPITVPPMPTPATEATAPPQQPSGSAVATPAPAEAPPFQLAAEIDARLKAEKPADSARADREGADKVYDARKGAPIWVSPSGFTTQALALMVEIRGADNYGLSASAFRLPTVMFGAGATPSATELADAEVTLSLAALKYARHARGGRLDPDSLTKMFDRNPVIFDPASVLNELAVAAKPDAYLRSLHPQHPQFERLRLKYVAVRAGQSVLPPPAEPPAQPVAEAKPAGKSAPKKAATGSTPAPLTNAQLERKLLANMEMWRWMPLDLGADHVINNIPEYTTRVVRGGKVVWSERIIVGKPETPTPIFSDQMELVVFKPFWNVPESIKWKELQPQLQRNPGALAKVGLRASFNGREVDPATVDWNQTDLRAFHVFQSPGASNALGQVKFLFPNKHDVYMHDTPTKPLFNNPVRAYSHGCMRVRDPLAFAEQLLGPDKGMNRAQVQQLAERGPDNNEIRLSSRLPVHVVYFTTKVEDDGTLKTFPDVYSHEQKIHLGLEGKAHLIQQPRIIADRAPPRKGNQLVTRTTKSDDPVGQWFKTVFNF
jgi:murein L,D-transpeptidase YcbB/YkuD